MPITKISRSSGAIPQTGFPTANSIRVDSDTETMAFGTGASGTTEKIAADTSSTQILSNKTFTTVIGYATGAGGTVTQGTSKATAVTLNKVVGEITLHGAALAGVAIVSFTLTNTLIAATDVLILNHASVGTVGGYAFQAQCAAGSAVINVQNNTAGSLSEAIVIRFALIKGVVA
jgi:hypothetical protein